MLLRFKDSRAFLEGLDLRGEIIPTTGHGHDHLTLGLDDGSAFTGDLPPENATDGNPGAERDWKRLREMGVKVVDPAHGPSGVPLD